ncbi:peptidylprolyl isomerase [Hyphococcus sp.]|uniref:peptidylprolyl isomerase n=1 Tax=Hyphococcus sp. TaxID=2038636 RepID=UPI003D137E45
MLRLISVIAALMFASAAAAQEPAAHAKIQTSMGDIVVELYPDEAPKTVENFLQYAKDGHYDRTLIHRVVRGFVIQGGGYSRLFTERPTRDPVPYEADNGLKNERGTLAMARGDHRDSATAQWFINLKDNADLDHKMFDGLPVYGYTVFGRVVDGMDVADAIGAVETGPGGDFDAEVPVEPVIIERVDVIDWPEAAE